MAVRSFALLARIVAFASIALLLAACGGGDDEADAPGGPMAPTTTTDADEGEVEGGSDGTAPASDAVDACALLDVDVLAELVEFEFGGGTWTEDADAPEGSCAWTNDEQLTTISVEVLDGIDDTLAGLPSSSGTQLEDVPVGASTATGVRDTGADVLGSLYVPAGADSIVKVVQSPLKLGDEQLIAVAEAAASAFENLPPAGGGSSASTEFEAAEGLTSVRFTVQSADADLDLEFEVTAQEVLDARNPVATGIACVGAEGVAGGPGASPLASGLYLVSATDIDRDPGLVTASVESLDEVDGPGVYTGRFTATDSQQRSVEVDGDLTLDPGMRSGELTGADGSGNAVAVTFECRPLG